MAVSWVHSISKQRVVFLGITLGHQGAPGYLYKCSWVEGCLQNQSLLQVQGSFVRLFLGTDWLDCESLLAESLVVGWRRHWYCY